jgi:hypothetical protein
MIIARVVLCAAVLLVPYRATAREKADVLIRHAAVVDVEHARISSDQAVATKGDRIVAVGNDAEISAAWGAARQIDGKGRFLIPGLWDMHVHFGGGAELVEENKALLPLYVAYGITTVRDCSGDLANDVLNWRREIAEGKLFGPRLLSSGPKIEGIKPVWKGTLETGSEVDVDQAVAKLVALKVDFVKITDNTLAPALFLYAVRKARAAGFALPGHPDGVTVGSSRCGESAQSSIRASRHGGREGRSAHCGRLASGRTIAKKRFSPVLIRQPRWLLTPNCATGRVSHPTLNIERLLAFSIARITQGIIQGMWPRVARRISGASIVPRLLPTISERHREYRHRRPCCHCLRKPA